jgi:hypothetical protein
LNVLVASSSRSRTVGIDIAARKSMHARSFRALQRDGATVVLSGKAD